MKITILIIMISVLTYANELIIPIPENATFNKAKAKLGKNLFFDPILSHDKTVSCANCHKPTEGWSDKNKISLGVYGRKGFIQSITILNARFNFRHMWNGKFPNLKSQINSPIHNNHEMRPTHQTEQNRREPGDRKSVV